MEGGKTQIMKPMSHIEAQQLSRSAQGSFSYFLPSGEQCTARWVNDRWYVVPAKDKLRIEQTDFDGKKFYTELV